MSSTITTGRRFGRLDKGGKTYVAWFDTSYESNVTPRTPEEHCMFFGSIEDLGALLTIAAHDAQGGMLRRPAGSFTASSFIRACATSLAKPFRIEDRNIALNVGTGFRDAMKAEDLPLYRERMIAAGGVSEWLDLNKTGKASFSLHKNPELVAALSKRGQEPRVSAWKMISNPWDERTLPVDPLKLPVAPAAKFQLFQIVTTDKIRLLQFGDGMVFIGSPSDIVYQATSAYAEKLEIARPGQGLATIRAIEAEVKKDDLPLAPGATEIVVDIRKELERKVWADDPVNSYLGMLPSGSRVERGYHRVTVAEIRNQGASVGFLNCYPFSRNITVSLPSAQPEPSLLPVA